MTRRLALVLVVGLMAGPPSPARAEDALAALPASHAGALRVYLVRHGQALSNLDPPPNLPAAELDHLTELGTGQARAVGLALVGRGVSSVYSSPAARARETAQQVATALEIGSAAVEIRLQPMAVGSAPDGRELTWKERIADWKAGRDPSPPGGESMERTGERVGELVRALARSRRGTSVVLVAHGEVIGAYLGRVRGTPPPERYPLGLANGSITVVDVAATGAETIRLANYSPSAP